jgi:hypothetical protein
LRACVRAATPPLSLSLSLALSLSLSLSLRVVCVNDLVDKNHFRQGMPGYGNEDVLPGDQLVQVDGHDCNLISLEDIRVLMQGERGSLVELTLARSGSIEPNHYKIHVKRHGRYEFETHTSICGTDTNVALDMQQQDGAFETL